MIRFESVSKSFGSGATEVHVLVDFSLEVAAGQFCTIMGPSGAGKSTVLHLLAGMTLPNSGDIWIGERRLGTMGPRDLALLRRRDVGFIFQFFHLLPYLSAEENIMLPLLLDGYSAGGSRERVDRVLRLVDLIDRRGHRPSQLSGGEMQRVAIARALVHQPQVVLADEPTGNLDSTASRGIMELLRRSSRDLRVTILMVTHDPVCASYGDRIVRLVDGQIVQDIDVSDTEPTLAGANR